LGQLWADPVPDLRKLAKICTTVVSTSKVAGSRNRRLHDGRAKHNMFRQQGGQRALSPGIIQAAMHSNGSTMKDDKERGEGSSGEPAKNPRENPRKNLREDRLKLALRENLKRRKSQARGRDDFAGTASNADAVSLHDDGEKAPGE
jgi:hypothetical protein